MKSEKQIIKEIARLERRIECRLPQIKSWDRKRVQLDTYHWEQLTCKGIFSGADHDRVEKEDARIYQKQQELICANSDDRVKIRMLQGQLKDHYRGARLD